MVDAKVVARAPAETATSGTTVTGTTVEVFAAARLSEALAHCERLARTGICAPSQSPAWVAAWMRRVEPDSLSALVFDGGRPVFALLLEIVAKNFCKVARFPGGTHANGNFPLADPDWLAANGQHTGSLLIASIAKARPDIDVLTLERLVPDLNGIGNPLLALPNVSSPNLSLAVDLGGGFDSLVSGASGKRKRKKHRSHQRKYESAGGFRRIAADTPRQVQEVLDAFFTMKAARFRRAGIANVFGEPAVQAFFLQLFTDALATTPRPFVLHGLEVTGKLRAITGSSLVGDRLICEFGAIEEDELATASPGEYLFFENIREACEQGLAVYDFSVGDELYKRLWCDIETQQRDVIVPLTTKGRLVAGSIKLLTATKLRIKSDPLLWRLTKAVRRRTAGQKTPDAETEAD